MARWLVTAVAVLLCASCATQKFGDAVIYGHTKELTDADIRAALAARTTGGSDAHVYAIEVVSHDRVRLQLTPINRSGHFRAEIARVRGKWHDEGASWSEVLPES